MSLYTMLYKCGKRKRDVLGHFNFLFSFVCYNYYEGVFHKTIIPLAFAGYEMIIANSVIHASLAIYDLISNVCSHSYCSHSINYRKAVLSDSVNVTWVHQNTMHIHGMSKVNSHSHSSFPLAAL